MGGQVGYQNSTFSHEKTVSVLHTSSQRRVDRDSNHAWTPLNDFQSSPKSLFNSAHKLLAALRHIQADLLRDTDRPVVSDDVGDVVVCV